MIMRPTKMPHIPKAKDLSTLMTAQFVLYTGVGAVIPTLPLYAQSIGLSASSSGAVIAAPALALLAVSKTAGTIADQARKPSMLGGMAVIALADLGTASAQDLWSLLAARLALGVGRGVSEAGERGMLADLATPELRGRALALQQGVAALGIALGAPLGGLVVQDHGLRASFLCGSVAATCLLYARLPETVTYNEEPGDWGRRVTDDCGRTHFAYATGC